MIDGQISAGLSIEILWDSRDSFINPSRGWLARASYRALFDGFLGADSSWEKANLDFRAYAPLSSDRRHKLAVWAYTDLVVDGVAPYFDLPSTASDSYGRSGRGYAEGHFRGERLAFAEVEYRGALPRKRPPGDGGIREHDDDLQPTGGRTALRQLCVRRGRWSAPPPEQAIADQPGVRHRLRPARKPRSVPDSARSFLDQRTECSVRL